MRTKRSTMQQLLLLIVLLFVIHGHAFVPRSFSFFKPLSLNLTTKSNCKSATTTVTTSTTTTTTRTRKVGPLAAIETADTNNNIDNDNGKPLSIWESIVASVLPIEETVTDPEKLKEFSQYVTLLRVGVPSFTLATFLKTIYPTVAITLANVINDSGVFAVVAADASQYIQNILTTSGLTFSLLVGQTYYFMYQQQEAIYLALFDEVTITKSLLEQVALVSRGRDTLYQKILTCIQEYVEEDLTKFNDIEPAILISSRPIDDPLEAILYLTSVGEPSLVYQTVKSLREARASRLGALQRKLPVLHMWLLWILAGIVLFTFPLLGAGVQTIGGEEILMVQSWYLSFIVFGMSLTLGVVNELRTPAETGAYNAQQVLNLMVGGLQEELALRLDGNAEGYNTDGKEPSVDSDGYYKPSQ